MKGGRKVFQQVRLDGNQNIIESISTYVFKNSEVFGMYRKTDGLGWLMDMSGNEIKLLVVLNDISDSSDGSVSLSPVKRKNICSLLKVKSRQLAQLISSLEAKDAIIRINYNDFMINPATFFRCSTNELKKRILEYYVAKKSFSTNLTPNTNFENE